MLYNSISINFSEISKGNMLRKGRKKTKKL